MWKTRIYTYIKILDAPAQDHNKIRCGLGLGLRGFRLVCFCFLKWENQTYFLKSANNFNMSSFESLLLSCLKRAENLAFLSRVPEASLNNVLKVKILLSAEFMKVLKFIKQNFFKNQNILHHPSY